MKLLLLIGVLIALLFAALLTVHRSRKGQHHVVYHVEGRRNGPHSTSFAEVNTWVYVVLEGTAHHTVNLPYTMSFYAPGGTPVAIAANYVDNSPNGWLEAKVLVDDKLYKSGRSSGNEIATVSGTVP